jgi:hypothetical protein
VEALQDDFQRRGVSKVDMGVNLSSFPVTARKAYGFHERQTVVAELGRGSPVTTPSEAWRSKWLVQDCCGCWVSLFPFS